MISVTTARFRKSLNKLPKDVQARARQTYNVWKQDNNYPDLHFKQVDNKQPIYSIRVGLSYRALGIKERETMIWFWIGSHGDYNNLLSQF